jgi:hypothetical protein
MRETVTYPLLCIEEELGLSLRKRFYIKIRQTKYTAKNFGKMAMKYYIIVNSSTFKCNCKTHFANAN